MPTGLVVSARQTYFDMEPKRPCLVGLL